MTRRSLALSIVSVACVFSGCGGTGEIIKTGDNTYMLRSKDSRYYTTSSSSVKESLYVDARTFCDKQDKKMVQLNAFAKDYQAGSGAYAEIEFKCQ